ncbi:aldo/keto reductase [Streptomyces sp. NPDC001002]
MSDTKRGKGNPSTDFDGRPLWLDSDKPTIDAVERIAKEWGVSMATIALAWVLKNPVVDAPVVGATKEHYMLRELSYF